MRRAAKVDANHAQIVAALRNARCSVLDLSAVGKGCPDLLVYSPYNRETLLMEVKDGNKSPSRIKLTEDQVKFHGLWQGKIVIVKSVDDALRAVIAIAEIPV